MTTDSWAEVFPAKHARKAEDAIDAIVDEQIGTGTEKLGELLHVAAYAMARYAEVISDGDVSTLDLINFATSVRHPPVTDRTRRRRARRLKAEPHTSP